MAFGIRWLKPELDRPVYYVHIGIILASVYALMTYVYNPGNNFLIWGLYLVIADFAAHTILHMD
jgi:hypothetical protein